MAIDQGTRTVSINTKNRTRRVIIDTPLGEDYQIVITRERVEFADGAANSVSPAGEVRRALSVVAGQKFSIGGMEITGAQLAQAISDIADVWAQEDFDRDK